MPNVGFVFIFVFVWLLAVVVVEQPDRSELCPGSRYPQRPGADQIINAPSVSNELFGNHRSLFLNIKIRI